MNRVLGFFIFYVVIHATSLSVLRCSRMDRKPSRISQLRAQAEASSGAYEKLQNEDKNGDDEEESFSASDLFILEVRKSITSEAPSLLKLVLTEKKLNDPDLDEEVQLEHANNWAAITGRLIKIKSKSKGTKIERTKLQLIYFRDKKMRETDKTINYDADEALNVVRIYIQRIFQRATLSTKGEDFELKRSKGQGKFKATTKGHVHIDTEAITAESLAGVKDEASIRRILEDRRLLLLSDPENREYKALYAEAKQRARMND